MSLSEEGVNSVRSATDRELVRGAGTVDQAVVVESHLRLKDETRRLTKIVIVLNVVLVILTAALVVPEVWSLIKWMLGK